MPETFYFGSFRLDILPPSLVCDGKPVRIQAQPLRLLTLLVRHAPQTVGHEQIRQELWGDLNIDSASGMHVCIRQIRRALNDTGGAPHYIETVPRRGYRFIAQVTSGKPAAEPAQADKSPTPSGKRLIPAMTAAGIALGVVLGLVFLTGGERDRVMPGNLFISSAASDPYLRGSHLLESGTPEDALRSRAFLAQAIEADPAFAPSYAAMAKSFQITGEFDRQEDFARKALEQDDNFAEGYLRLAVAQALGDWNWAAAEQNIRKAIDIMPANAEAYHALAGIYSVTGRLDAAVEEMEKALAIDPVSTLLLADYGMYLYYNRQYDEARMQCQAALELAPGHTQSRQCLYKIALVTGDHDVARGHAVHLMQVFSAEQQDINQVESLSGRASLMRFEEWRLQWLRENGYGTEHSLLYAERYAASGKFNEALAYLMQAHENHETMTPFVLRDPIYIPISHQARFEEIAAAMKVRLPDATG